MRTPSRTRARPAGVAHADATALVLAIAAAGVGGFSALGSGAADAIAREGAAGTRGGAPSMAVAVLAAEANAPTTAAAEPGARPAPPLMLPNDSAAGARTRIEAREAAEDVAAAALTDLATEGAAEGVQPVPAASPDDAARSSDAGAEARDGTTRTLPTGSARDGEAVRGPDGRIGSDGGGPGRGTATLSLPPVRGRLAVDAHALAESLAAQRDADARNGGNLAAGGAPREAAGTLSLAERIARGRAKDLPLGLTVTRLLGNGDGADLSTRIRRALTAQFDTSLGALLTRADESSAGGLLGAFRRALFGRERRTDARGLGTRVTDLRHRERSAERDEAAVNLSRMLAAQAERERLMREQAGALQQSSDAFLAGLRGQLGGAWASPFPGVAQYNDHGAAFPGQVVNAALVNLCAPGVGVSTTRPGEGAGSPDVLGPRVGAQLSVNANFFNVRNLAETDGMVIQGGQRWGGDDHGYAGHLAFGDHRAEVKHTWANDGHEPWIDVAVAGHPTLVVDGHRADRHPDAYVRDQGNAAFVGDHGLCAVRHPRTLVGLSADKATLIMVVVDGRAPGRAGMTCAEAADTMLRMGAHNAIALDGGGSAALWIEGQGIQGRPSDGRPRPVANTLNVFARGSGEALPPGMYRPTAPANGGTAPAGGAGGAAGPNPAASPYCPAG